MYTQIMSTSSWNFVMENYILLKNILEREEIRWYFWAVFSTSCLSTTSESTQGTFPLKICPVKVVPSEKTFDISPPQFILHNLVQSVRNIE